MLDEFFWNSLLTHIETGRVVPIVGQGLLQVPGPDGPVSLQRFLAGKLAEHRSIPATELTPATTVADVFCHPRFPKTRTARNQACANLKTYLDQAAFPPPETLRQLARIRPLSCFISTTFDNLLPRALELERGPGVRAISFSDQEKDLPPPEARMHPAYVYHLFGRADGMPYFAITEADYLESFNKLISESGRVQNLTDLLSQCDLLFLGTGFPDWLSRFLLRFAKRGPLGEQRDFNEVFADTSISQNSQFVSFISNFSQDTLVYTEGGAAEFVAELARRWEAKHPVVTPVADSASYSPLVRAGDRGMIFLSYNTRADLAAARRLYEQLTAAGANVWFDKKSDSIDNTLNPGVDYEQEIRKAIKSCSIFVPVISRAAVTTEESFFRKEWGEAIRRLPYFTGLSRQFIWPVIIDDSSVTARGVPPEFHPFQYMRAPAGELTPQHCTFLASASQSVAKSSAS
jgi:hypothetical protein